MHIMSCSNVKNGQKEIQQNLQLFKRKSSRCYFPTKRQASCHELRKFYC